MTAAFVYSESADHLAQLVCAARVGDMSVVALSVGDPKDESLLFAGADETIILEGESDRPENYASAVAELLHEREACLLLVESTVRGRELAASVAGRMRCAMFSDISKLSTEGDLVSIERDVYGGAAVSGECAQGLCVATVGEGVFDRAEHAESPVVERRRVEADTRIERLSEEPMVKEGVDLAMADAVVGVGLGLAEEADLAMVRQLADGLGAGIGCTRDLAEGRGWMPKEHYIGITGAVIKPKLYIALGISGATQHTYGIRDAKVVVAVNKAKDAAIFRVADYGIVGDIYDVVPRLSEALRAL